MGEKLRYDKKSSDVAYFYLLKVLIFISPRSFLNTAVPRLALATSMTNCRLPITRPLINTSRSSASQPKTKKEKLDSALKLEIVFTKLTLAIFRALEPTKGEHLIKAPNICLESRLESLNLNIMEFQDQVSTITNVNSWKLHLDFQWATNQIWTNCLMTGCLAQALTLQYCLELNQTSWLAKDIRDPW